MKPGPPVAPEQITAAIHLVRGHRVMLDVDLAALYGVTTRRLNEQVTRNAARFPADFGFRLTEAEVGNLKSQIATSSRGWGGRNSLPRVFTEHGAVMLASVLRTGTAVDASIQVVRAFVRLRGLAATHAELARRLDQVEQKYDGQFKVVFQAIRDLMAPPVPDRKRIGLHRTRGENAD